MTSVRYKMAVLFVFLLASTEATGVAHRGVRIGGPAGWICRIGNTLFNTKADCVRVDKVVREYGSWLGCLGFDLVADRAALLLEGVCRLATEALGYDVKCELISEAVIFVAKSVVCPGIDYARAAGLLTEFSCEAGKSVFKTGWDCERARGKVEDILGGQVLRIAATAAAKVSGY